MTRPLHDVVLEDLTDEQLVDEAASTVMSDAILRNSSYSDKAYAEAKRRGKPWLYVRGWNSAYTSQGHTLSDSDIAAAQPPKETTETDQ